MSEISTIIVNVKISDGVNNPIFTFKVIVFNLCPKLLEDPPTDVYFDFNKD